MLDLLAKPVLDLAIGVRDQVEPDEVRLMTRGWIYRDDEGGHVDVLETRPWHRIADTPWSSTTLASGRPT